MKAGIFLMPCHPPERVTFEGHQWDLDCIELADQLGFGEAWIGEHFTAPWESAPAPDLLIAQALQRTSRITIATGAHLLPFHHPAELAHRVAYMDHMAQGRYMFGIGAGGVVSDHQMFNIDMENGEHREMTRESLEIILGLWANIDGTFEYEGKFWNVRVPDPEPFAFANWRAFLTPYQKPHPPIAVTSASPDSETLRIAGERGYIPMSLGLNEVYLGGHWDSVEEGAAAAKREAPSRSEWRILRQMWVGETDEEALETATNGMLGRAWHEYFEPLFSAPPFPFKRFMKHDQEMPDEAVDLDYVLKNVYLVGSPETIVEKVDALNQITGGFGTLLWQTLDHIEERAAYEKGMRLFVEKVAPALAKMSTG